MCNGKVELDPVGNGVDGTAQSQSNPTSSSNNTLTSATAVSVVAAATTRDGQVGRRNADASFAVSLVAESVEIYSASNGCWVVADIVRPASPTPAGRDQGRGGPGRVTVEYVLGGERRKKTVRANDRSLLRPRCDTVLPMPEQQQQQQQQQQQHNKGKKFKTGKKEKSDKKAAKKRRKHSECPDCLK